MSSRKEFQLRARTRGAMFSLMLIAGILGSTALLFVSSSSPASPGPSADLNIVAWQEAWSRVLRHHVDDQGRVDFSGLSADRADLDEVVRFIAVVDPASSQSSIPTQNTLLAYYLNAYNALAMYGVLEAGVPKRFDWLGRMQFFYFRKFRLGGRTISLYSLENDVIRPLGDPRVHFALNCMSISCPRLPQKPFTALGLDSELDAAAHEFINEDRNVHLDSRRADAKVSAIFEFYTTDFVAKSTSLAGYINRYRIIKIPANYKIAFAEYDWTINAQSHASQAETP